MAEKDNSTDEDLLMALLIVGGLALFIWVMWTLFTPQITNAIRYLRLGEMAIVQRIVPEGYAVQYDDIPEPVKLSDMQKFLRDAKVEDITFKHIAIASDMALLELRTPMGVILLLMAVLMLVRGPHSRFKRQHTLETLIQKQVKAFPYIHPFVDFDPSTVPPRSPGDPVPEELPLFAEALSPEEWIAYHRLPMPDGKIDREATAKEFAKQLKQRWQGWQKCQNYEQILLAAFSLRAQRKRDESDHMLGRASICWNHKTGFNLLKDPKLLGDARAILRGKGAQAMFKVLRQHAYTTTAIMRALDYARSQGGVLSPGQFIWLRGHDRGLWYPLNNMGRQAYHPEAIGALAHYRLEKVTERPVPTPKVDAAVAAMVKYFEESGQARPIPQLAYKKKSAVKGVQQGRKSGIMKPVS